MTSLIVRIARPAWVVVALAGLALVLGALVAMPEYYRSQAGPAALAELRTVHLGLPAVIITLIVLTMVPTIVYFGVALIVRYRASPDSMALVCAYMLVLFGCGVVSPVPWVVFGGPATLLGSPALTSMGQLATPIGLYAFGVFFAVFPSGRFVPRPLRWAVIGAGAALVGGVALGLAGQVNLASNVFQLSGLGLLLVDTGAQVYRYRRVSSPAARQQTKWVLLGLACGVVLVAANQMVMLALPARVARSPVVQNLDGALTWQLVFTVIVVGIAVAMLRFRLWDVDLVINRTLLYAALTAAVVGVYVLVIGYLGRALRTETTLWMSLVATGVVAVVIQPLRGLLQRGINRVTYGQRDEPYAVVTELGRRLATSLGPRPLASVVESFAGALKLPYAAIVVYAAGGAVVAAQHGDPVPAPVMLPLTYQSEVVGQLLVASRRPGESLTPRDVSLLQDLAVHLGPAAHAVALGGDLQRSRERLVTAREEERRRLRRDLHDGLGPTLAGLALKAGIVADLIPTDPRAAQEGANRLSNEIRATIADVRRLVYGLRPPSLDELGLVGAVREAALACRPPGPTIVVEGDLSALPAAVEVAAYRIIHEALTNVDRHAGAGACTVRMARESDLILEISDDGVGIAATRPAGVGLLAINERAAELGGSVHIGRSGPTGTTVRVRIPLPADEEEARDIVERADR
ncbi:histidine kinase [Dactylosporangium sp. McL0621]|uniref:sensor histidine kinase n=1 Tax=Dactylosporangium sp. McL0621 TaxID=3415678 RepID=UPI003CEBF38C